MVKERKLRVELEPEDPEYPCPACGEGMNACHYSEPLPNSYHYNEYYYAVCHECCIKTFNHDTKEELKEQLCE